MLFDFENNIADLVSVWIRFLTLFRGEMANILFSKTK